MSFLSGLFTGSSGGNNSSTTNSKSSTDYTPQYNSYVNNILSTAQGLGSQPFQPGPSPDARFAPAPQAMQQGWSGIMNNSANYMPAQNAAMSGLNTASQTPNAWNAGAPALGAAYSMPGGYQAAQPYLNAASQTWPGAASQYTNPYLSGAIGYGNQLATQGLMENTLPKVMDQFVTSGGQLGRQNYNNQLSRTLRDFGNTAYGNAMTATSNNYNNLYNQFNSDQTRLANIGQTQGGLANSTMGQYGNLATTAGGLANTGSQQGLNMASGAGNLAQQLSGLGLNNAQAQIGVGQQQQGQQQQQLDYAEQQRQAGIQWPYQMVNFMRDAQAGLQIPTTNNAQSTTTSTAQNTGSTSPAGSALGTLGAVASLGGSNGFGLWGSGGGSSPTSTPPITFTAGDGGAYGAPGGPVGNYSAYAKRGGHFSKQKAKKFAAGGHAAVVKATAQNTKRSLDGAKVRRRAAESENEPRGVFSGRAAPKMPVMMPPPAPPPGMGGPRPPMPAMKRGGYFAGSQRRGL